MSTLPLLYSNQAFVKPKKQGGIFSLGPQNRPHSKSLNLSILNKIEPVDQTSELTKNNITNYYTSRDPKNKRSISNTMGTHRYAKSFFIDSKNVLNKTIMVSPDTVNCRVGADIQQVDNIGTLHRNICTSIVLFHTILKSDQNQMASLSASLKSLNSNILSNLQALKIQMQEKCANLYQKLSAFRRQTHMQTKVNNHQVQKLSQDTVNSKSVMATLQQKADYLRKQCNM